MDVPFEALEQLDNFRKLYKETGDTTKKFLKKRKKSDVQRKIKTIYDHFEDYSKEQIDTVLENLSEEEKELIVARYGENLNNPVPGELNMKQSQKFYRLIPKIRKILNSQNSASKKETKEVESENILSNQETANLTNNLDAVMEVIKYIYNNIMYAELNTKSDYCQACGYNGEILLDEKLEWYCPNCGNRDHDKLNVARRTCGYIGTNFWNKGRTQEIKERVVHLDNKEA